jgi:hypothetical protein
MVTTMRSEDAWLGLPYDIFCNTTLQRCLASELNIGLGTYTHNVGSMHLYEKNFKAAGEAVDAPAEMRGHSWDLTSNLLQVRQAVDLERAMRIFNPPQGPWQVWAEFPDEWEHLGPVLRDIVGCTSLRWGGTYEPISPALSIGVKSYVDRRRK